MPRIAICTTAALVALFTACRDGAPTIDAPSTHRAGAIPLRAAGGGGGGGSTKYLTPTGQLDVLLDANPPARTRYRIDYHNGRVIPGDADVYLIYYGDWSTADANAVTSGTPTSGICVAIRRCTSDVRDVASWVARAYSIVPKGPKRSRGGTCSSAT